MKRVSDRVRSLLAALFAPSQRQAGLADRTEPRPRWNIDVLSELATSGDVGVVPGIAPALLSGNRDEAYAAARTISALLAQAGPEELIALSERMRSSWFLGDPFGDEWLRLTPRELQKWVGPGEPGILVLRLSSFHANGYVREAAVMRLALLNDGAELPYLLLRLNDWVPQVRAAALDAVVKRVRPDYVEHFVDNLELVVRLESVKRSDQGDVLAAISSLLALPSARTPMIAAMHSRSATVRRASFRFLTRNSPDDLAALLTAALSVEDPIVRLWVARTALAELRGDALRGVLDSLDSDRSALVRREALAAWADHFPGEAFDRLMAGAMDTRAATRAEARFRLRDRGVDFAQIYRAALATDRPVRLASAVAGLTETGRPEDASALRPLLSHQSPRVRRAAVRGLVWLAGERYLDAAFDVLRDPARSVSSAAGESLKPHVQALGGPRLWSLLDSSNPEHVRECGLLLLERLPKWDAVSYLLLASAEGDESLASQARKFLGKWNARFNVTQTVPTREQLVRLHEALAAVESALPATDIAAMRFAIRPFGSV